MSIDREEADRLRLEGAMRRFYATQRRSLRWWKHAREYVSLLRLVRGGLLRGTRPEPEPPKPLVDPAYGTKEECAICADRRWPPYSLRDFREWRWNTPDGKAPYRY
jgi:hypothetical protein